jgi:hypothetical protein
MTNSHADRNAEAPVISTYDALVQDIILTLWGEEEYKDLATRIADQFKHDDDSLRLIREALESMVDEMESAHGPSIETTAYRNREKLRNGESLPIRQGIVNYITSQDWDTGND